MYFTSNDAAGVTVCTREKQLMAPFTIITTLSEAERRVLGQVPWSASTHADSSVGELHVLFVRHKYRNTFLAPFQRAGPGFPLNLAKRGI